MFLIKISASCRLLYGLIVLICVMWTIDWLASVSLLHFLVILKFILMDVEISLVESLDSIYGYPFESHRFNEVGVVVGSLSFDYLFFDCWLAASYKSRLSTFLIDFLDIFFLIWMHKLLFLIIWGAYKPFTALKLDYQMKNISHVSFVRSLHKRHRYSSC